MLIIYMLIAMADWKQAHSAAQLFDQLPTETPLFIAGFFLGAWLVGLFATTR